MKIRIVARVNPLGIGRDLELLPGALSGPFGPPAISHSRSISPVGGLLRRSDPDECILFIERVGVRWLRSAARYLLMPHQEWYPPRRLPLLRRIDHILCKTHHAKEVFSAYHPSVHYVGFTSVDQGLSGARPDYSRFLHLAGGSPLKGTEAVLDVWSRHPEWPRLTLVQHRRSRVSTATLPSNVELITEYMSPAALRELQNACGIHLCPSLSEGWGHHIVEGMSCRAVLLTTDAPPMNELIAPDRGVRVPWERSEPRKLGINFHVDRTALEPAISELIEMPTPQKERMGAAARSWFEENNRAFRERLCGTLIQLIPELGGAEGRETRSRWGRTLRS